MPKIVPLTMLKQNSNAIIKTISPKMRKQHPKLYARLNSMGFIPGRALQVNGKSFGNYRIGMGGDVLALEKKVAKIIMVEASNENIIQKTSSKIIDFVKKIFN